MKAEFRRVGCVGVREEGSKQGDNMVAGVYAWEGRVVAVVSACANEVRG